jgi:hypothetical protein
MSENESEVASLCKEVNDLSSLRKGLKEQAEAHRKELKEQAEAHRN